MNAKELMERLTKSGIDTTHFAEWYEEYYKKYSSGESVDWNFSSNRQLFTRYNSLMTALEYFKPYFSKEEFSKLVCKKFISYSRLHCACIFGNPSDPELYAGSIAQPNPDLPINLKVICSKSGYVSVSTERGYSPKLVRGF